MPVKIFFCYAHKDKRLLNELRKQLRPLEHQGLIDMWHDRNISAGTEWEQAIIEQLNAAQIILLLVSPDFMDSAYCYSIEMKRAVERHEHGEAHVIPVILRPVYWEGAPIGKLQALPTEGKPVVGPGWHNQGEALFNVAEGIRLVVEKMTEQLVSGLSRSPISVSKPTEQKSPPTRSTQPEDLQFVSVVKKLDIDEESRSKLLQDVQKMTQAERLLFEADKYPPAPGLMEKEKLVKQAVELWPDFKQREYRQLGIDMSIAVINGFDPTIIMRRQISTLGYSNRLRKDEIVWLIRNAISYLEETVLHTATPDTEGLLYLASMYGYQHRFDEMMKVIDQAIDIDEAMQEKFREPKILATLLRACGTDATRLERLRNRIEIPPATKKFFCDYVKNFDLKDYHGFIEWLAVKRPDVEGEPGIFVIKITPPYPVNEEKVNASALRIEDGMPETIVAVDKLVTIEELFNLFDPLFFLIYPNERA